MVLSVGWILTAVPSGRAAPAPPVGVVARAELTTFGFDAQDYTAMATELAGSALRSSRLATTRGSVLVLGPVDADACAYPFDEAALQEKLQTALHRAGTLEVSFAANALRAPGAQAALVEINRFNFEKGAGASSEALRLLAATANVDFLLFGRLSTRETQVGDVVEVTYVFNWKIGDCRTGLLVWTEDREITKRGPRPGAPLWFEMVKADSPTARFAAGRGQAGDRTASLTEARADAVRALLGRINAVELAGLECARPVSAEELGVVEWVANHATREGRQAWVLARAAESAVAAASAQRRAGEVRWRGLRDAIHEVMAVPRERRAGLLPRVREQETEFLNGFPLGVERALIPERAWLELSRLEWELGDHWAARRRLEAVQVKSGDPAWRAKATALIAELPAEEGAERETWLLRRELEGRVVRLRCAWQDERGAMAWAKATADLQRWLEGYDAVVRVETIPREGDLRAPPVEAGAGDVLLAFVASGAVVRGEDRAKPGHAVVALRGDLWAGFYRNGKWTYPVTDQIASGATIFGEALARDLLALEAVKRWRVGLSRWLGQGPESHSL